MERVRIDDVQTAVDPSTVMKPLTEALGATDVAVNYYELAPGDTFAYGYHAHETQEEVFYVQAGTVTFETEAGEVTVEAGEVVRFAPGEFQRGWNRGDERVVAVAIGAPRQGGEVVKLEDCPTCGERTRHDIEVRAGGEVHVTVCRACGGETARYRRGPD
jgi:uncharacterized cupin superfamily protein